MLSHTKCKQILNKGGLFYTDEEISIIKEVLYKLAEIEFNSHTKTINFNRNKDLKKQELISLVNGTIIP